MDHPGSPVSLRGAQDAPSMPEAAPQALVSPSKPLVSLRGAQDAPDALEGPHRMTIEALNMPVSLRAPRYLFPLWQYAQDGNFF